MWPARRVHGVAQRLCERGHLARHRAAIPNGTGSLAPPMGKAQLSCSAASQRSTCRSALSQDVFHGHLNKRRGEVPCHVRRRFWGLPQHSEALDLRARGARGR